MQNYEFKNISEFKLTSKKVLPYYKFIPPSLIKFCEIHISFKQ